MKLDTLLFDLDGTLVDSNELILETFRRTFLKYLPNRVFTKVELLEMMGPPLFETFQIVSKDSKVIESMINTYRSIYTEIEFDYIKPYPYMIEMLEYFKGKGFNIGIVTTKFQVSAMPSIKEFGIDRYIDVLIGLDDVKYHKPHPEPVFRALERFNNPNAIMIGDNSTDLLAGKNAGIMTCGVDWSLKKETLLETKPNFWIQNFKELINVIEKYNQEEQ